MPQSFVETLARSTVDLVETAAASVVSRRRSAMIPDSVIVATLDGDRETLRKWIESANVDINEPAADDDDDENTLLHFSMAERDRENRCDLLHLLLELGADVNARNAQGSTALHWCEHPEEVALLLDRGADIDALDVADRTPLRYQADGKFALVHLMVCRGANLFLTDNRGLDAESYARGRAGYFERVADPTECQRLIKAADFLAEVKAAGSWRAYWRAPRVELVRLRSLCDRGRAEPPSPRVSSGLNEHSVAEAKVLERLFGAPTRSSRGSNRLPNEIFWTILTFWRSSRDGPE